MKLTHTITCEISEKDLTYLFFKKAQTDPNVNASKINNDSLTIKYYNGTEELLATSITITAEVE